MKWSMSRPSFGPLAKLRFMLKMFVTDKHASLFCQSISEKYYEVCKYDSRCYD